MPRIAERYVTVRDEAALDNLLETLKQAATIAFDLETHSFKAGPHQIVGWAFSVEPGKAWYIPVDHNHGDQLDYFLVINALKPILEDASKTFVAHNVKFDHRFLRCDGIEMPVDRCEDSLLEAYVCQWKDHTPRWGLKDLEYLLWRIKPINFEDLFGRGERVYDIGTVPIDMVAPYACLDADYCLRVHARYFPLVADNNLIYAVERKLWPIVQKLEDCGVQLDVGFLERSVEWLAKQASIVERLVRVQIKAAVEAKGKQLPNDNFNIGSHKQLAEILFGLMELPVVMKTKAGAPSLNKLALERLAVRFPVCQNIETYSSMLNTIDRFRKMIDLADDTGRIHTSYNQAGAGTGRFSSSAPNLQNIAREKNWQVVMPGGEKREVGIKPRNAFCAKPGYYLLEFDFSAIEFIIMAAMSGEQSVVDAYIRGDDVHKQTASLVMGKPESEVTKADRDKAKTWNYLIIYGGSGGALSLRTGQDRQEADAEIARFYTVRPNFLRFSNKTVARAKQTHTVDTVFDRKIYIPEFDGITPWERSKAERACVNAKIQGSAADVHKIGIIRADQRVHARWTEEEAHLVLQTHDSQTWEVSVDVDPAEIIGVIAEAMPTERAVHLALPRIRVDVQIGLSWGNLVRWGDFRERAGLLSEKLDGLEKAQERITTVTAKPAEPEPVVPLPGRLLFRPGAAVDNHGGDAILDLIRSTPGENIVVIVAQDGTEHAIARYPTSLTARELESAMRAFFPSCNVSVDREILIKGVMEGIS